MKTPKERAANTFVYGGKSGILPLEDDNLLVVVALVFRCNVPDTLYKHFSIP